MRIAIASVQVPFTSGGAEIHALNLKKNLQVRGHEVDIITIPFKWYPEQAILDSILMARLVDLSEANGQKVDLLIGLKFPAYYIEHTNKVLWILHQHRQAYELWGTQFGDLDIMKDGMEIRRIIQNYDNRYIPNAKKIFANSKTVSERLKRFNNIDSEVLYHPPEGYELLQSLEFGDYVFYPSRIDSIKRQYSLIKALPFTKTNIKIVLAGNGDPKEIDKIKCFIIDNELQGRVKMLGFISEEEKRELYARCLAVYFGPYQEDYGYVTLEAFYSHKAVITHPDSGGPMEFVRHMVNGIVVEGNPEAIAQQLDFLYLTRNKAKDMGENGYELMKEMKINWEYVIERLTGR